MWLVVNMGRLGPVVDLRLRGLGLLETIDSVVNCL